MYLSSVFKLTDANFHVFATALCDLVQPTPSRNTQNTCSPGGSPHYPTIVSSNSVPTSYSRPKLTRGYVSGRGLTTMWSLNTLPHSQLYTKDKPICLSRLGGVASRTMSRLVWRTCSQVRARRAGRQKRCLSASVFSRRF